MNGARRARVAARVLVGALAALGSAAHAEELDCLIEPKEVVSVSSATEGVLERVEVERGQQIDKGQLLASLESSVERAALAVARSRAESTARVRRSEAQLQYGDGELARTEALFQKNVKSTRELQETETNRRLFEMDVQQAHEEQDLARLELAQTQALLDRRSIKSPVRGVVVEVFKTAGEFADEAPILKLAQIDPLVVSVFAPVSLLGKIRVGERAQVVLEQPLDGVYDATVSVVDRVVDAASGTWGIRLELPNPRYALPAGVKCKVRFPGASSGHAEAPGRADPEAANPDRPAAVGAGRTLLEALPTPRSSGR